MMFLMRRRRPGFSSAGSGRLIFRRCASLRMISRSATRLGMIPGSATSLGTISRISASLGTIPRNGTGTPLRTIPGSSLGMIPRSGALRMIARGSASLGMIPGATGSCALDSSIPTSPLAVIVAVIKILVIVLANRVIAPLRILVLKIRPVLRMAPIPLIPPRRIPVSGSHNIGLRVCVIRGKSNFRAEKVIQDPIQEPIAFKKGPGRIGPNIRLDDNRLDRVGIVIALGGTRSRRHADGASSQHDCQQQKNN